MTSVDAKKSGLVALETADKEFQRALSLIGTGDESHGELTQLFVRKLRSDPENRRRCRDSSERVRGAAGGGSGSVKWCEDGRANVKTGTGGGKQFPLSLMVSVDNRVCTGTVTSVAPQHCFCFPTGHCCSESGY